MSEVISEVKIPEVKPEAQQKTEELAPPIKSEENLANWKKFREEKEKEKKARLEAEQKEAEARRQAEALQKAMETLLNQNRQAAYQPAYQEELEETEEQRIARLVSQQLEKERARQEEEKRKRELETLPETLSKNYSDFNEVCSEENAAYMEYHYPEVWTALKYMPEGIQKYETAYKAFKRLVPYQTKHEDQRKIEKNQLKPQANIPAQADTTPVGTPWKLTEQRRQENWRRMQKDMKSFG